MIWLAVVGGGLGCYLLKLAGLSVPTAVLQRARVQRVAALLPVALLAALIWVQTVTTGRHLTFDARLAGLAVALVAVWRKAPFLVVVATAAFATAVVRALA